MSRKRNASLVRVLVAENDDEAESDCELNLNKSRLRKLSNPQGTIGLDRNVQKRLRLLSKPKGSIALDMNVQGNPSMQEKQKYDIPLFDFEAYGSPLHWNEDSRTMVWGKKARQLFRPVPGAVVDPNRIIAFFKKGWDLTVNQFRNYLDTLKLHVAPGFDVHGWRIRKTFI